MGTVAHTPRVRKPGAKRSRSKTGHPQCSEAVRLWKTEGMSPQIAKTLAQCRAMAKGSRPPRRPHRRRTRPGRLRLRHLGGFRWASGSSRFATWPTRPVVGLPGRTNSPGAGSSGRTSSGRQLGAGSSAAGSSGRQLGAGSNAPTSSLRVSRPEASRLRLRRKSRGSLEPRPQRLRHRARPGRRPRAPAPTACNA